MHQAYIWNRKRYRAVSIIKFESIFENDGILKGPKSVEGFPSNYCEISINEGAIIKRPLYSSSTLSIDYIHM